MEVAKKRDPKKNKKTFKIERKSNKFNLPEETRRWILGMIMVLIAAIIGLSFFDLAGVGGRTLMKTLFFLIGKVAFAIPLIFLIGSLVFLSGKYKNSFWPVILAIFILILGISGILGSLSTYQNLEISKEGGWLGYLISWPLYQAFGFWVTIIIFSAIIIFSGLIFWQLLTPSLLRKEKERLEEKPLVTRIFKRIMATEPKLKIKEISPLVKEKEKGVEFPPPFPELKTKPITEEAKISVYQPPPLDLIEADREVPTSGDIKINSAIIKRTLQNFDILVEMSEVNIGPTVTQYNLKPAEGVKLSKITALTNDLSLALASHPIRIEAPIPGRPLVGIEVPNKKKAQLRLRNLISHPAFQNSISNLTIVLGRDVAGNPVFTDLARMPHLLVAGATGTGKTIYLNSLILSLLYQNGPETLRFILIDPKRVEFPVYNELPHLLCPVIFDFQKTINVLKWLTEEMERRFDILSESKTRDIASYNEMIRNEKETLPYIILIIDELADLMASRGREIEAGIVRLAQMARAVGIHLIVATQRPSVEVITGLIKANITSRITFQVASQVDSRTVLDMAGAEKLLGSGDMLYISAETAKPRRIQGVYVSEKEVKKVVNWLKSQAEIPKSKIEIENKLDRELEKSLEVLETKLEGFPGEEDPLYQEAKRVVIEARKASASLLQRRLRIGYARAARLIDLLEERGVVGPLDGAKPREVYFKEEEDWPKI